MKQFKFEDDSSLDLSFDDEGKLEMTLQAQHMGEERKITAASVILSPDNVAELVNWLGNQLLSGDKNG